MRSLKKYQIWIYILGFSPLAFFYDRIRLAIGNDLVFVALAIIYLLFIKFIVMKLSNHRL